jgi:hypothetical protein
MKKISNSIAQWVWLTAAIAVMVLASSVELLDGVGAQEPNGSHAGQTQTQSAHSAGTLGLGEILNLKPPMGFAVQAPPGKVDPR